MYFFSLIQKLYDADIRPIQEDGHLRTYVQPIEGGGVDAMLRTIEGKMARLTHDIPTLRMDRTPIDM